MEKGCNILVVDAQGGGVGKALVTEIKKALPEAQLTAVGTNSLATSNMLKAGADIAATGENPVLVACRKASVIVGPIGIVIADSMNGEVTPAMAHAIASADAARILIPFANCDNHIVGIENLSTGELVRRAVAELVRLYPEGCKKA
ncbi:MAG: DUF3842 family protein [Lachnospiraceae bacterium]|nr:DUF3842 family protein [Lachnospiraceae bacterium]MCR5476615.1 DUF3842 family protein [Lachnospiraceae bacterium]